MGILLCQDAVARTLTKDLQLMNDKILLQCRGLELHYSQFYQQVKCNHLSLLSDFGFYVLLFLLVP